MGEMTAARQVADRVRGIGARDPAARRIRKETYAREMVRIAEQHDVWMREHGLSDPSAVRKPFSKG